MLSQPFDPQAYTWYGGQVTAWLPGLQVKTWRFTHLLIPLMAAYLTEGTGPSTFSHP